MLTLMSLTFSYLRSIFSRETYVLVSFLITIFIGTFSSLDFHQKFLRGLFKETYRLVNNFYARRIFVPNNPRHYEPRKNPVTSLNRIQRPPSEICGVIAKHDIFPHKYTTAELRCEQFDKNCRFTVTKTQG